MPRIIPGTGKASPTDRNYSVVSDGYDQTLAPHAATARFTDTVNATHLGILLSAKVRVTRITAAAPVGQVMAAIRSAGTPICDVRLFTNVVADQKQESSPGPGAVFTGSFDGVTEDLSTGGTVRYELALIYGLYDR